MPMSSFSAEWLTSKRLRIYPRIFLAIYILVIFSWVLIADGVFDTLGKPLGTDFTSFYTAAKLALDGHASLAYDFAAQFEAEKAALGPELVYFYPFAYPPTFMLLLMPLGALPYLVALCVWQVLTLAFFVFMAERISGRSEAVLLALAFPAVFVTLGHGQSAFLAAGLFAGALHYLDRKPVVAGLFLGLLTFKPHLGVLIPFVLIVSGRLRVCFLAGASSIFFAAMSWVFLGSESWSAFVASTGKAASRLNGGMTPFYKMQSLFTSLSAIGLDTGVSYVLHGILALGAAAVVLWVWQQHVDIRLKSAALGTGALMVSPYLLDYDLAILVIPIACLASYGLSNGFRPGLINLLCLAWLAPFIVRLLNLLLPIPWTPIMLSALLYQIIRLCLDQLTGPDKVL